MIDSLIKRRRRSQFITFRAPGERGSRQRKKASHTNRFGKPFMFASEQRFRAELIRLFTNVIDQIFCCVYLRIVASTVREHKDPSGEGASEMAATFAPEHSQELPSRPEKAGHLTKGKHPNRRRSKGGRRAFYVSRNDTGLQTSLDSLLPFSSSSN